MKFTNECKECKSKDDCTYKEVVVELSNIGTALIGTNDEIIDLAVNKMIGELHKPPKQMAELVARFRSAKLSDRDIANILLGYSICNVIYKLDAMQYLGSIQDHVLNLMTPEDIQH